MVQRRALEELPGYEPREIWVLAVCVDSDYGLSQQQLASKLGFNPNVMVKLLDQMERKHLVKRVRDRENRQKNRLEVLQKGRSLYNDWQRSILPLGVIVSPLNADEREHLARLLLKLLAGG